MDLPLRVSRSLDRRVGAVLQQLNLSPMQPGELFELRNQNFIFCAKIANQLVRFIERSDQPLDVRGFVWRRHKPIY